MNRVPVDKADVNRAWARFKQTVQHEPVPTAWTHGLATSGDLGEEPDVAAGRSERATDERVQAVDPGREPFRGGHMVAKKDNASGFGAIRRKNRKWRNTAAVAAAAVIVVGGLATPWGQKVAAEVMQTFYVQQLTPISNTDLQTLQNALEGAGGSQHFSLPQYGTVTVKSSGTDVNHAWTLAGLEKTSGYPIPALPDAPGSGQTSAAQGPSYSYASPETVTLQLHVNAINQLLRQLGTTVMFPMSANNVPIRLTVPAQVTESQSTGAPTRGQPTSKYESLTMMREPSVQVPGTIDLNQVRQAAVSLPFMPSDIVTALDAPNWATTLYVPQTNNTRVVKVNGQNVMVSAGSGQNATAVWIANGYFYNLSGSTSQFPSESSILNAVKEIMG